MGTLSPSVCNNDVSKASLDLRNLTGCLVTRPKNSFENSKLALRRSLNAFGLAQFLENGGTFDPKLVSKPSQGCPFVNFQVASKVDSFAQGAITSTPTYTNAATIALAWTAYAPSPGLAKHTDRVADRKERQRSKWTGQAQDDVVVTWSASDAGSGVVWYDLDVRVDDGEWERLLNDAQDTSCAYPADYARRYAFRVTATDNVGNAGQGEANAATATMIRHYLPWQSDHYIPIPAAPLIFYSSRCIILF